MANSRMSERFAMARRYSDSIYLPNRPRRRSAPNVCSGPMAAPRKQSIRGSIARGASGTPPRSAPLGPAEPVADPAAPRLVVDYALDRRRALHALFNGGGLSSEACDADPYLLRAAKHHGEPADGPCPVCRDAGLVTVTYVYGDQLGPYAGRVRQTEDLATMATQFGEFAVYVVEVCGRCHWNFLRTRYVLGDGVPRRPPATPRDLLEGP